MLKEKIKEIEALKGALKELREKGKNIVFTNGCFDIIHSGHVEYLEEASLKGDALIVAVNSDVSVKKIKGDSRPVNSQVHRMKVIAALESVSFVVSFDEDTPYELISELKPDILVKGGDWALQNIVGSDIVIKNGGKVESIPFREGFSTTAVINKIRKVFDE